MANPQTNQVGSAVYADGAQINSRAGKMGDLIVSEAQGRFYEQTYRGLKFAAGLAALTSINNATFTIATLSATCTPVLGVWNPQNSGVNLVILQAILQVIVTAATNTGPGGFMWAYGSTTVAISTATAAWNRKTLGQTGAQGKNVSGVALTGLSSNLAVAHGSALQGGSGANFSFVGTAAGQFTGQSGNAVENFDGSIIVPPGGVLALLAAGTPVAHSAHGALVWDEVPQ